MRAPQEKLKVRSLRIQEGNSDMFFHFSKTNNKEMTLSIIKHLQSLQDKIEKYFPPVSTENYKWVRNPFLPLDTHCILNLKEEEELIDILNDGSIKLLHREILLDEFWIKIQNEYPNIGEKALVIFHNVPMQNRIFRFNKPKNKKKREATCCGGRNASSIIECAPQHSENLR